MQIINLSLHVTEYTSNVYHISGDFYQLSDIHTLIDVGRDPVIMSELKKLRIGIGKSPVDQVILTHSHFDHSGLLKEIFREYHPVIYTHPKTRCEKSLHLQDREEIKIGDKVCEIIFTPGHSDDSICIYCPEEKIIFSGDIPMRIYSHDNEYTLSFLNAFEYICSKEILGIYPGHGDPFTYQVNKMLHESLENMRRSQIIRDTCV